MLFKHIITPEILKHPIVVILLMFLVSVTTIVRVGKRPKNKTTTAGKTVKEIIKKAININTFWKRLR
ncbi:MAG: hypothetical protein E7020_05130 [Alphaproteobacteria bacterium]|nr:hypothetical protein [Alphaproteobacteria bacterium]